MRASAPTLAALAAATVIGVLWSASEGTVSARQHAGVPSTARVAFVPLDDRPPCLQYALLLAAIADTHLLTPPRAALGRFTTTGDSDAIARWLDGLDAQSLDALVVSVDMLAYGGLVGSWGPRTFEADARRRLEALVRVRQRRADLPIYAFSSLMRLAPTADGFNDAWGEKLARWAEIAPGAAGSEPLGAELRQLEAGIPADALSRYKAARARNLAINLAVVDLAARNVLDYVIFAQDDGAPKGVHVADREAVLRMVEKTQLGSRAVVQPGTDHAGLLLLTHALTARHRFAPRVEVVFSSEAVADAVMPFEDRPLRNTVAAHIASAGAQPAGHGRGDLRLFVYGSRHETSDRAEPFAKEIDRFVTAGGRAVVVDIDTNGDVQGASLPFTEALRARLLFPRLFGYASWNTAGNTIGTALPQGILFALATDRLAPKDPEVARRVAEAQIKFLLHRLVTDFLYQGLLRRQVIEEVVTPRGMNPLRLEPGHQASVEQYLIGELKPLAQDLASDFARAPLRLAVANGPRTIPPIELRDIRDVQLSLPWGRTFEAEIDFKVDAAVSEAPRKLPPPRLLRD